MKISANPKMKDLNTMTNPLIHYRQGDVLLIKTDSIPADAKPVARDQYDRVVLANGEITGHAHVMHAKGVCGFSTLDNADLEYLLVDCGGSGETLNHELVGGAKADHDPEQIPDGKYEVPDQVEYTPLKVERVTD
jgi:hypothetical protein